MRREMCEMFFRKYPAAAMLVVFVAINVCLSASSASNLVSQVTGVVSASVVSLAALLAFRPASLARPAVGRLKELKGIRSAGLFLIAAAGVGGVVSAAAAISANPLGFDNPDLGEVLFNVFLVVLMCLFTGLWEEAFFRGLLIPPLSRGARRRRGREGFTQGNPLVFAVVVSSLLFGLSHVLGGAAAFGPSFGAENAGAFLLLVFQALLKTFQALLFGVCLAAAFLLTRSVWVPAAVHSLFDVLYLAPTTVAKGEVFATYLTGSYVDLVILAITIALMLPPSVKCLHWLGSCVVPYDDIPR